LFKGTFTGREKGRKSFSNKRKVLISLSNVMSQTWLVEGGGIARSTSGVVSHLGKKSCNGDKFGAGVSMYRGLFVCLFVYAAE
jgi:hypothetical protein